MEALCIPCEPWEPLQKPRSKVEMLWSDTCDECTCLCLSRDARIFLHLEQRKSKCRLSTSCLRLCELILRMKLSFEGSFLLTNVFSAVLEQACCTVMSFPARFHWLKLNFAALATHWRLAPLFLHLPSSSSSSSCLQRPCPGCPCWSDWPRCWC